MNSTEFNELIEIIDKNQNRMVQLDSISNINSIETFYLIEALEKKLIDPNQVLSLGINLKSPLLVGLSFRFQYNRANPNLFIKNIHVLVHVIKFFVRSSNTVEEEQLITIMYLLLFKNSSINSNVKNNGSNVTIKEMLIQNSMTSLLDRLESFKKNIDEYILFNKLSFEKIVIKKKQKKFDFLHKNSLDLLGYSLDDYDLLVSFNLREAIKYHCSIHECKDVNRLILYSCIFHCPDSMKYLSDENDIISPIAIQKLILTINLTKKYRILNEQFNYHLMKILTFSSMSKSFSITDEQLNSLNVKFERERKSLKIKQSHLIQEDSNDKLKKLINYLQIEKNERIIFNEEEIKSKFQKLIEINSLQVNDLKSIIRDEEEYNTFNEFNDRMKLLMISMMTLNRIKFDNDYTFFERIKQKKKRII